MATHLLAPTRQRPTRTERRHRTTPLISAVTRPNWHLVAELRSRGRDRPSDVVRAVTVDLVHGNIFRCWPVGADDGGGAPVPLTRMSKPVTGAAQLIAARAALSRRRGRA